MIFRVLNKVMDDQIGLIHISIPDRFGQLKVVVFFMDTDVFGNMIYRKSGGLRKIDKHFSNLIGHYFQVVANWVCKQLSCFRFDLVA